MRNSILALVVAAFICPVTASATPIAEPCDLVDHEALVALKFDSPKMLAAHKEVVGGNSLKTGVDTCTITHGDLPAPSLTITSVKVAENFKMEKRPCEWQPVSKMVMGICNTAIKNHFVTFVMLMQEPLDPTVKAALSRQVERLAGRPAISALQ